MSFSNLTNFFICFLGCITPSTAGTGGEKGGDKQQGGSRRLEPQVCFSLFYIYSTNNYL